MTSSTKYQGIDGYFCDIVILTVSYELPSYSFRRMSIFATYFEYKYVNAICTVLWNIYPYPLLQININKYISIFVRSDRARPEINNAELLTLTVHC